MDYDKLWSELDEEEKDILRSFSFWSKYCNTRALVIKKTGFSYDLVNYLIKRLIKNKILTTWGEEHYKYPHYCYDPKFKKFVEKIKNGNKIREDTFNETKN